MVDRLYQWQVPCPMCEAIHRATEPHDVNNPTYRKLFEAVNYREPTWEDAMYHCEEDVKNRWRASIERTARNTAALTPKEEPNG